MTRTRQPARPPAAPHPQRAPHLASGICASWPDADVWHRQGSRPLALALCARCPVLAPCAAWATTVPPDDPAVIGGTTPADRRQARQARQAALTAAIAPGPGQAALSCSRAPALPGRGGSELHGLSPAGALHAAPAAAARHSSRTLRWALCALSRVRGAHTGPGREGPPPSSFGGGARPARPYRPVAPGRSLLT